MAATTGAGRHPHRRAGSVRWQHLAQAGGRRSICACCRLCSNATSRSLMLLDAACRGVHGLVVPARRARLFLMHPAPWTATEKAA